MRAFMLTLCLFSSQVFASDITPFYCTEINNPEQVGAIFVSVSEDSQITVGAIELQTVDGDPTQRICPQGRVYFHAPFIYNRAGEITGMASSNFSLEFQGSVSEGSVPAFMTDKVGYRLKHHPMQCTFGSQLPIKCRLPSK